MWNGAGRLARRTWRGQFKGTWWTRCRCRAVPDLCDEYQIQPAQFYLVAAVLRERRCDLCAAGPHGNGSSGGEIAAVGLKLARKNDAVAELMKPTSS